jgi:hypothetical protein
VPVSAPVIVRHCVEGNAVYSQRMSWLTPTRRVDGPGGQSWEIYVTRGVSPGWRLADYLGATDSGFAGADPVTWPLAALYELPMLLLSEIVWPLLRFVVTLPLTLVRAKRSRIRMVEAIAFYPHETRHAWTTTPAQVGRVVDEVAAALAGGHFARPAGASYLGERSESN